MNDAAPEGFQIGGEPKDGIEPEVYAAHSHSKKSPQGSRADRIQATAAVAAAIISALALLISTITIAAQQESIEIQQNAVDDQRQANEEARTQVERRYASRVSWWLVSRGRSDNPFKDRISLAVQNRSAIPIYWPTLRIVLTSRPMDPGPIDIMLPHIPPCRILYVPLEPGYDWDQQVIALYFSDGSHIWSDANGVRQEGGLTMISKLDPVEVYADTLGVDDGSYPGRWDNAADCGES